MISTRPLRPLRLSAPSRRPVLGYELTWRQRQLLVGVSSRPSPYRRSLEDPAGLTDCLQRSPVKLVKLDMQLGESALQRWADAAHKAGKAAYLRLPVAEVLPSKRHPLAWRIKRICDRLVALALIAALSPLFLMVAVALKLYSPGPLLFRQWRVGARGKLFQVFKFRTMVVGAEQLHNELMGAQLGLHKLKNDPRVTPLGQFLRKYSLDELPQLFNVMRGEMSLVGPRPWALYDAVRVPEPLQQRLHALPGITGAWQVQGRSELVDLTLVNRGDLQYLQNWSIAQDLNFLILTVPRVLSGSGAY